MGGSEGRLLPVTTAEEVREQGPRVAVLPVGSFEQHGAFLPLVTDTVVAVTLARAIATEYQFFELPAITISCSHEHAGWKGTVSISARTLHAMVNDIADSLRRSDVARLVIISGHGGNYVLGNAVQESFGRMALFPTELDWARARTAAGVETTADDDMHAGELETSILLHAYPELVRADYQDHDELATERDRMLTTGLAAYTESGVVGRPSLASAEKGRLVVASLVASFRGVLDAFDQVSR